MPAANDCRLEIEKAIQVFQDAANRKDAATIASLYAEGATLLPPGAPPVKGRENIRGFWQSFMDAGASDAVVRPVSVESSGDLASEIGEYEITMPVPEGRSRSHGKYLVTWQRQTDGSLKMIADAFSPNQ